MNGYNFTERIRVVLARSREEAVGLSHEYVGTEHLLLGLVADARGHGSSGVAVAVLRNLGIDPEALARRIHGAVTRGRADRRMGPDLPYTSRAKKVLELAMEEARDLKHSYVGTEHLLLGLLREEGGIAAQVLSDAGLRLEKARAEVVRLLGAHLEDPESAAHEGIGLEEISGRRIDSVEVVLRFHDGEVRRSFATAREAAEYLWRGGPT